MSKILIKNVINFALHPTTIFAGLFIFVLVLLLVNYQVLKISDAKPTPNFKYVPVENNSPTQTMTPSPIPTSTPKPVITQVYVNPDPVIDCKSSAPNCNGSSIRLNRSQCSNIICCQIGSNWSLYPSLDSCKSAQNSAHPNVPAPQRNTPSTGNNYYCWNNAYGYAYYTSSGDQCNADNLKYSTYKTCNDTQKLKENNCSSACQTQLDSDRNACYYAYVSLVSDPDKYGDCLNGPDSASSAYSSCLSKCSDQYALDIQQCHY